MPGNKDKGVPLLSTATGEEPVVSTEIPFTFSAISAPAFCKQSFIVASRPST